MSKQEPWHWDNTLVLIHSTWAYLGGMELHFSTSVRCVMITLGHRHIYHPRRRGHLSIFRTLNIDFTSYSDVFN